MSERMASCARLTSLTAIPPRKRTTSVAGARGAICRNESRRRSLAKTPNASFVSRLLKKRFGVLRQAQHGRKSSITSSSRPFDLRHSKGEEALFRQPASLTAIGGSFLFLVRFSPRPAFHHLIKIFWEFLAGLVCHTFSHLFGPAGHRLGIVHVPQLARIGKVF